LSTIIFQKKNSKKSRKKTALLRRFLWGLFGVRFAFAAFAQDG
jgi:hypothetical protein